MVSARKLAHKRGNLLYFDPRIIVRKPEGWNLRKCYNKKDEYKASIREIGLKEPLSVMIDGDQVVLTHGYTRHLAILELISEGIPIDSVPCLIEEGNEADLTISMLVKNDGEALLPIEQAEGFRRLKAWGWSPTKIASHTGKSVTTIEKYLKLLNLPPELQQQVIEGEISSTTTLNVVAQVEKVEDAAPVLDLIKEGQVSAEAAIQTLKENQGNVEKTVQDLVQTAETAQSSGRKRGRVSDRPANSGSSSSKKTAPSKGKGKKQLNQLNQLMQDGVPPSSSPTLEEIMSCAVTKFEKQTMNEGVMVVFPKDTWKQICEILTVKDPT